MKFYYIITLFFTTSTLNIYAQDVKEYKSKKLFLEEKIAQLWQPNNVLDGDVSSSVFIPFFIHKNNLITKDENKDLIKNGTLYLKRETNGKAVDFSVDSSQSEQDININME